MKVLISAYACEPKIGSEPGVGWNWVQEIAKRHEVWVITRKNNRSEIGKFQQETNGVKIHYEYYDLPKWLSFWKKGQKGVRLYYVLWQIGILGLAIRLNNKNKFDVIHHLTFGNIWLPSFLFFLKTSYIWGPIGGAERVPKEFTKEYSKADQIKERVRKLLLASLAINPLFLYQCRAASLIIAKTKDTERAIPGKFHHKVVVTTDVAATTLNEFITAHKKRRIISVGRLDPWRGVDLAIEAFQNSNIALDGWEFLILGDGSDRVRLEKTIKDNKLTDSIKLGGVCSHKEYLKLMAESSVFVNTSLRESSVTATFDALTLGLAIVCMDLPGASRNLNERCSIKIQNGPRERVIERLSSAFEKLATKKNIINELGRAGQHLAKTNLSWASKGKFVEELYAKYTR